MICIFPFAGYSNSDYSAAMQMADSLVGVHKTDWASAEYERAAFLALNNTDRTLALLAKTNMLLDLRSYQEAEKTSARLVPFSLQDSLLHQVHHKSALSAYLNQNFEGAYNQLLQVEHFLPLSYQVQSALLSILTLNELKKWEDAKQKTIWWVTNVTDSGSHKQDSVLAAIELAYREKKYPKTKNPDLAKLFSSIIPGSGQLYTGHIFDAAFSAIMVLSGLGIAAAGVFIFKYYVTGAVLGYAVFQRFYQAGQKRSSYLAERYNYRKPRKYNDAKSEWLIEMGKALKA